ncbi:hypothetical protein FIM12_06080 [SAR202 cluster bacterium AD-804-J14_MRT_500m]|nr:hypothetical protein [SAR202 cluster bacterium AD-804-J14_MRT_500m]
MSINTGTIKFEMANDWGQFPSSVKLGQVPGAAVDSKDRVYILNRGNPSLIVLDRDGNYIDSLAEEVLEDPHGINVGPNSTLYIADRDAHVIVLLDSDGKLGLTIGTRGRPSAEQSGMPFNRPTSAAVSSQNDIYISDGYSNSRVHKYYADGSLDFSWGGDGTHPGQFKLPHGICIDSQDRIFVADRENNRIQAFDEEGDFLKEWAGLLRPADVDVDTNGNLHIAELDGRVSVLSYTGEVLARWGEKGNGADQFAAPHGICVDSHGDVYVTEVGDVGRIQKFIRTT